jgi:hypothetical protein
MKKMGLKECQSQRRLAKVRVLSLSQRRKKQVGKNCINGWCILMN